MGVHDYGGISSFEALILAFAFHSPSPITKCLPQRLPPSARLRIYNSTLAYERVESKTHDSTRLRGNLYCVPNARERAPIVIFVHGIGLVKGQNFRDSDGLPRNHFNWTLQAEDFIDVVTNSCALPEADQDKVFGWGVAHVGGRIAMAAAFDKRIAGIVMFLPCIDASREKARWGESILEMVQHRFHGKLADGETVQAWRLSDDDAAGASGAVLSGDHVRNWLVNAQRMVEQGGIVSFNRRLTLGSIWEDYKTRPIDFFHAIKAPFLWIMATDDVACGPVEFTQEWYSKLQCPKKICILHGEHLAQYFDPGFPESVEAMLAFLENYAAGAF